MPEPFDALAVDIARFQTAHIPGLAKLAAARGVVPAKWTRAEEIPAVPTDVFKHARVATFPEHEQSAEFWSSGTTVGARGRHSMRTTETYDAGAVAFGRAMLLGGLPLPVPVVVLGPSPEEAPQSSLTHMCERFTRAFGSPQDRAFYMDGDTFDLDALDEAISRLLVRGVESVLLMATSFAFVHLLDALGKDVFRLPSKSRIMQTGGFKGKSREVERSILRKDIAHCFGLDVRQVVCEYGMTELSSQFYEATAVDPDARPDVYREPPWARVVPVDPETLLPVPEGEVGIARIEDLLNVDSAVAVLAADRVRRVQGGFELMGRLPGAPPRGCSISTDEILGRHAVDRNAN